MKHDIRNLRTIFGIMYFHLPDGLPASTEKCTRGKLSIKTRDGSFLDSSSSISSLSDSFGEADVSISKRLCLSLARPRLMLVRSVLTSALQSKPK